MTGYRVGAVDGEIGHIDDFIIDDQASNDARWEVRYVIIDTRNWLPGQHVLLPAPWADSFDWDTHHIHVGLTQDVIQGGPEYGPNLPVNRRFEEVLYGGHGGRKRHASPQGQ